jgi:ABC-type branched-subunit amino acid transport system permease subunit
MYLIIYGLLLILVVRFIPQGLAAGLPQLLRRRRAAGAA